MEDFTHRLIGNRRTRIYHDPLCKHVEAITDETEVWFFDVHEAHEAGYSSCQWCNPADSGWDEPQIVMLPQDCILKTMDKKPATGEIDPDSFFYNCPQCGKKVRDDCRNCPYCGEVLFEDIG